MEVLFVSAELSPYVAETPASEAVLQLGRALTQLGHGVTVAMPRAPAFEAAGLMVARRLTPLSLRNGATVTVYDGQLPSGVRLVLFDGATLLPSDSVFGSASEQAAPWARFGTLCQAAIAFAEQRASQGTPFDVVHAHGLPALAVAALSTIPTLITFYDAADHGLLPPAELAHFGLSAERLPLFEFGEQASLLKGGMLSAGAVTTISPRLSERVLQVEFAGVLGAALNEAGVEVIGVSSGLDYAVCNPATDTAVPVRYDAEASEYKGNCKTAVCRELELEIAPELPLLVFTQPLETSSGADRIAAVAAALCKLPVQLVVAGTGAADITAALSGARLIKRDNFRFIQKWTPEFERRLLSAADIALYPNRDLGLGSALRLALRYGAVPVAFASPVAEDVVVDCPSDLSNGTGFLFDDPSAEGFRAAVERAVAAVHHEHFGRLRRRVMRLDQGWERSGRRYAQLYKNLLQPSIIS